MKYQESDIPFTGERFIPGVNDLKMEMEHMQRYLMAKELVRDKTVLDAACGEGYGSAILASAAESVTGIDISEEVIAHAKYRYCERENLSFCESDITCMDGIASESMDAVVSFETIEHISEEAQRMFLSEIRRVLKKDGILIMSTPNKHVYSDLFQYHNEYHLHEFDRETFQEFLQTAFKNIRLLSQSFEVDCVINDLSSEGSISLYMNDLGDPLDTCRYFIAIASNSELPSVNLKSLFFGNYGEYNEKLLRIQELQKEEEERNAHIKKLDRELEEKGSNIEQLNRELIDKDNFWKQRIDEAHTSLEVLSRDTSARMLGLQESADRYKWEYEKASADADETKKQLDAVRTELIQVRDEKEQKDRELTEKSERLDTAEKKITQISEELEKSRLNIDDLTRERDMFHEEKDSLEKACVTLKEERDTFKKDSEELTERFTTELRELEEEKRLSELEKADLITQLETSEKQKQETIDALNQQMEVISNSYEEKQRELRQIIRNKEGHIDQLLEKERQFLRIQERHTYRLGVRLHDISEFLLPADSMRRFVFVFIGNAFKHPVQTLRLFSPRRILTGLRLLRTDGTQIFKNRYYEVLTEPALPQDAIPQEKRMVVTKPDDTRTDFEEICFDRAEDPEVSIIIPVFNQFSYTYECLKAIKLNTSGVSYEIIIGDDNSTDRTAEIQNLIRNITVQKNSGEKGFLMNCNQAASAARGKYILFLNNDTQVQENWLLPLKEVLDSDPDVGMTGSKLLYENGELQEAGGIVWRDGSAWNYGNRKSPEDPEFNYLRETDYISGAAIMVRADLWKQLGGFDEQFVPAYYEDTDLAFRIRECGYKVIYQPASAVVHFEGISNGTDVSGGMKSYQQVNAWKFYRKWESILQSSHFENGQDVFLAKDRSRYKQHILVVDHYVPHFDMDAGGRCTFMWLKLFVRMGMQVTFIGDNFYKHEPYTTVLNQMGIEVLYGNYYCQNIMEWLRDNLHYFDYIYLQRPHISIKYIDLVKKYSRGKIFYFAHDLHFLRLTREYELTGNPETQEAALRIKKDEMHLFENADVVHVVGSYEQSYLQSLLPDKVIRNIPLYIYEEIPEDINKNFAERHDLLFVGGFGHPPNIDAVLWFAGQIFGQILEKIPDIRWHIVGGKVPPEVQALAGENIIIHGFLPDEDLEQLYRTCRLAVVPLRYGAGVKGKVLEAAYYQIPLVTTTIGGEGISHSEMSFAIEDDPDKMADLIVELYQDTGKLEAMSDNGIKLIRNHYTLNAAQAVFRQDM